MMGTSEEGGGGGREGGGGAFECSPQRAGLNFDYCPDGDPEFPATRLLSFQPPTFPQPDE